MKTQYFHAEMKSVERVADGVKIKGFASTPDIDRQYDIVIPAAFQKSLEQYMKDGIAPALLRSHDANRPVGKILMEGDDAPTITDQGLLITAIVTEAETAAQVEAGEMQTFSIGYIPAPLGTKYEMRGMGKYTADGELKMEVRIINDLDWIETSIVSTPANPKAIFSLAKSVKSFFDSLPSTLMKTPCEFCPEKKNSCGMIGKKSICTECISKMEFKSEDVKMHEEEKKEETSEKVEDVKNEEPKEETKEEVKEEVKPSTETVETPVETQGEGKTEEVKPEDSEEEKAIVTPEQKETIEYLASVFGEVSKKTVVKTEEKKVEVKEEKKVETESKAQSTLDLMLPLLSMIARKLSTLEGATSEMQQLIQKLPAPRGKGMIAFQHSISISEKKVETVPTNSLKNAFAQARQGKSVSIGNDE